MLARTENVLLSVIENIIFLSVCSLACADSYRISDPFLSKRTSDLFPEGESDMPELLSSERNHGSE